jgi:hypothetical protein
MNRDNHYEAALEAYLRERGVGFVAVDEAKRSLLADGASVKSLDFIVVGPDDAKLVVDVKGRKFPNGPADRPRKAWQNWVEQDDPDALLRWAAHLGPDFRGVLAFVYHVLPHVTLPEGTPDTFAFRGATYLMRAVDAADYRDAMTPRSRRWGTVHLPAAAFRQVVRPFAAFLESTHHKNTKDTKKTEAEFGSATTQPAATRGG